MLHNVTKKITKISCLQNRNQFTKHPFYQTLLVTLSDQAGNYMFKVNNRNIRARCEICSKLTIKTPERRHFHFIPPENFWFSGVFMGYKIRMASF